MSAQKIFVGREVEMTEDELVSSHAGNSNEAASANEADDEPLELVTSDIAVEQNVPAAVPGPKKRGRGQPRPSAEGNSASGALVVEIPRSSNATFAVAPKEDEDSALDQEAAKKPGMGREQQQAKPESASQMAPAAPMLPMADKAENAESSGNESSENTEDAASTKLDARPVKRARQAKATTTAVKAKAGTQKETSGTRRSTRLTAAKDNAAEQKASLVSNPSKAATNAVKLTAAKKAGESIQRSEAKAQEKSADDSDDDTKEWEVERIVDSYLDEESLEMLYEVKWMGYPESENTWEPLKNLRNCIALIKKFEAKKK